MRGHIRRRSRDTWAVVIDVGRDATGKRRQKWHTVKGTKRAAQQELTRLLNQLQTGIYVEPSKLTVSDFLKRWLNDYAKTTVSPKTFERYKEIVERNLDPALGGHYLPKLKPIHIQAYYSDALQNGRKSGKGGLSGTTVLQHHRILRQALKHAVRWQLLVVNPADAVDAPRRSTVEIQPPDTEAIATLLSLSKGIRLHFPILLAVTTGMRRGEILGLRWDDVDVKRKTLSVRRSLCQTRSGVTAKVPKTSKANRIVALPTLLIEELRTHKSRQAQHRLQVGAAYANNDLVCPDELGGFWPPNNLTSAFRHFVKQNELPQVRFHDLRHSHATQLLKQGIHPKIVSERLGHSTIGITLDTYSHVLPGMQEEAALKIDMCIRSAIDGAQLKSV